MNAKLQAPISKDQRSSNLRRGKSGEYFFGMQNPNHHEDEHSFEN
jgi:hypothetical protein